MADAMFSLIVQVAGDLLAESARSFFAEVLLERFRKAGVAAEPGLDLGDRGPEGAGGHAVTAVVVSAFGADGEDGERELGRTSREIVAWLASAPPTMAGSVRVELVNRETGAVAWIDSGTPAEAAALLGPVLRNEWASAPVVWDGQEWAEEARSEHAGEAPPVPLEEAAPEPVVSGAAEGGGSPGKRILVIADEWLPAKGGLSAFSRYLCLAFAALGPETYCLVPDPSPRERADADKYSVRLIGAPVPPGRPRAEALMQKPELPGAVEPDIVIGHSWVTGYYAKVMTSYFPKAQRVHFIHMSADDTPFLKRRKPDAVMNSAAVAEQRASAEADLARGARLTACVGPLLHEWFARHVHEREGIASPVRLDPGFDAPDGFSKEPRTRPPFTPRILLFGRLSDDGIKGVDLAARAVGAAMRGRTPHREVELLVRGMRPEDDAEVLKEKLEELADCPDVTVLPRNFTDDLDAIRNDLRSSSLVLMPSRVEGFGLAGLEAITSGTPVRISGASGLGLLLDELLSQDMPEMVNRLVVPVRNGKRHEGANVDDWAMAIAMALGNLDAAFADAATVRSALAQKRTWAMAVTRLLEELKL
ncbi:glycosyltransferase family 4 protein [Streptomyces chartreusis]|uniref:glycosyltransferase family 4 protein n=1 Tax=Streptomyces chartreusis TaxID=1969 RepID=UPI0036D766B0